MKSFKRGHFFTVILILSLFCLIQSAHSSRIVFSLDHPYMVKRGVYKGQLHAHSTRSDGKHSPEGVMKFYYEAGYHFLVLSEHNQFGRRVIPAVRHSSPYNHFIMIPGYEMFSEGNDRVNFYRHHILGIGLLKMPEMKGAQYVINYINENSGIPILCHPEWRGGFHYTYFTLETLTGYHHIEKTTKWDFILSRGRRVNMIMSDDFHVKSVRGFNKGYIMVYADSLKEKNILESIRKGNYYSSNGLNINSIKVETNKITVKVPEKSTITFYGFAGCALLSKKNITELSYDIVGNESYIRVVVMNKSNGKYRFAYTNPVYVNR